VTRDSKRADRTHTQCIADRRRFGREIESERERASRPIVDHDLLMEFIRQRGGQHACQRIRRTAGGLRHDHADRMAGILSGRASDKAESRQHERNKKYRPMHEGGSGIPGRRIE